MRNRQQADNKKTSSGNALDKQEKDTARKEKGILTRTRDVWIRECVCVEANGGGS